MFPNESSTVVGKAIRESGRSKEVAKGLPSALRNGSVSSRYEVDRLLARKAGRRAARAMARDRSKPLSLNLADGIEFASARTAGQIHRAGSREALRTFGKAAQVEELPVPGWARASFAPGPVPVIDPLNVYAAGRLVAFGGKRARGEVTWPWMRGRMARGGLEQAQGLTMLYSPAGFGERTL